MAKYYSGMIDEGSWKTASGDIAVFNTKYRRNLKSLVVQLEPIQSGSGDPSPDNIRPISGRTGATVWRSGINLLPPFQTETRDGITISVDSNGIITINGTATQDVYFDTPLSFTVRKDTTIRLYGFNEIASESPRLTIFLVTTDTNPQVNLNIVNGVTQYTVTKDTEVTRCRFRVPANFTYANYVVKPMLTVGANIAANYIPYTNMNTYPVSWETEAGTVYGGELDVVSGVLTVTHKMVDGSSLNWAYWTNDSFYVTANDKYSRAAKDVICSCYPSIVGNVTATFGIYVSLSSDNTRNNIYLADTQYSHDAAGAAQLKADMTGQQIVYPLATSQTYQLTPQQIQTLIGENVIWSDAGPVDVEYWS